jgi:formylglycine-generating enzyme required for sulfatase activity
MTAVSGALKAMVMAGGNNIFKGLYMYTIVFVVALLVVGCGSAPPSSVKVASEMALVPAGEFVYGTGEDERKMTLGSFYIDIYEVTNKKYKDFVTATKRREPRGWFIYGYKKDEADHPMTLVNYKDAQDYCEWAGGRLPTEQEWERAARGIDGRRYPWGDDWDKELANTSLSAIVGTTPVGSYPKGKSPVGAFDMAGNLWEWTSSDFTESSQVVAKTKVVRGGSWGLTHRFASTYFSVGYNPTTVINNIGFRCARATALRQSDFVAKETN